MTSVRQMNGHTQIHHKKLPSFQHALYKLCICLKMVRMTEG